jgi:hypothetical protein
MDRRKRSRTDDERERNAQDAPPAPTHPLLELQRGAGNHAVSAMLARAPETKEKEKPKEEAAAKGTRATLPGIGTIPLESVQFGVNRRAGPPRGREEKGEKKDTSGEIVVTSKAGPHSQKLFKASLEGRPMTVEIVIAGSQAGFRLVLKGAIITSFSVHEEFESWTLHFEEMEHSTQSAETQ